MVIGRYGTKFLGTVRFKVRYVLSVPFIGTLRLLNLFEVRYVSTVRLKF